MVFCMLHVSFASLLQETSWQNYTSKIIGVILEVSDKPSILVVEKLEAKFSPTVANKEFMVADFS